MKKIITLLMFFFYSSIFSQVSQQWLNRFDYTGNQGDFGTDITVDNLGNAIIAGYGWGLTSKQDYIIIKYNPSGVQQWLITYDGPGDTSDYAESVTTDINNNVYVTGWSWGSAGTMFDYATIKYNANGVQQWLIRYDGPGHQNDIPNTIIVDSAGNVYVAGYSIGNGTSIDFATIKYNSAGVQQWVSRYNDPSNQFDVSQSMVLKNGYLYVVGYSNKLNTGYDYVTIKYNPVTGDTVWTAVYDDPTNGSDYANSIAVDNAGNVCITGYGRITTTDDYITVKYNSNGVQQWASSYDGPAAGSDRTFGLVIDNQGNSFVTGYSYGTGTGQDWATVKYNTNGVQQWVSRVAASGSYADVPYEMAIDPQNNVYVTGNSAIPPYSFDYFTVKYNNATGDSIWTARYNGTGNSVDIAQSIALDAVGNVFVTGYSRNSSSSYSEDIVTIKYNQLVGIHPVSNEIPSSYELYQNKPNPFNPETKIKFTIHPLSSPPSEGWDREVVLKIYNVLGREVATLVNEKLKPGSYEVEWDGSNYPSGVYFYKLISNDYTESKKMILLK